MAAVAAVAFNRPELFRHVVIMSSGAATPEQTYPAFFANSANINQQFKTLWIAIGKDDALVGAGSKTLTEALT